MSLPRKGHGDRIIRVMMVFIGDSYVCCTGVYLVSACEWLGRERQRIDSVSRPGRANDITDSTGTWRFYLSIFQHS
jgi:hypothetical protein